MTTGPAPDDLIASVLAATRVIAMVGASTSPGRPSHGVMGYLIANGFTVIPVNPTYAGQTIHGQTVMASLDQITGPVDLVDIFRRSDAAGAVADEAVRIGARFVWMQLGVVDEAAAARAEAAGLTVIMDRCIKIEHARLSAQAR